MKNTKARKREGADLGDVISRAVQAGLNRRKARLGGSKLAGAMAILAACAQAMVGVGDANAGLSALGENHPVNGFPTWVQDSNGVTLQLCLDELNATGGAGICIGTPVEAGNLLSENIGFGPEAFYYMASASLPVSTGSALGYEVAAEAAWGAEIPEEGQQFAFCRLRIRVDQLPVAGIYRLIHPYGVEEFEVTTPGNKAINMTRDIGGFGPDFSAMLYGDLGPFLTAVSPEPPAGYLGDGGLGTLYQVEGSPTGVNYIRLEGPAGSNLDGLGNDFVETDQFSLMGKLFTEAPTPLKVERVTIEEDAARIDVFAKSSPNAELFMTLDGAPIAMDGDSSGGFYGSISVLPGSTIPAVVNIAADDPVNTPVNISVPISDRVQITLAEYNSLTQMLRVDAHSSLEASGANLYVAGLSIPGLSLATASVDARPIVPVTGPEPIRTGVPITGGTLEVMVPLPPSQVLVVSSYGGLDTLETLVTTNPANVEPIASDDTASVDENSSVAINVLGNDVDPDGTLPLDGVQLVAAPVNGTAVVNADGTVSYTPNANFNGADQFSYRVVDADGAASNPAVVRITVNALNDAPVASDDSASVDEDSSVSINVLGNDVDPDGTLPVDGVQLVAAPVNGTAVVNADGTVSYTPKANFNGVDLFSYRVVDADGAGSNTAVVRITVNALNDAPVASDDSASVDEDSSVSINVLGNDVDPDGALPVDGVQLVAAPVNGTAVVNADGTVSYTPNANFNGADQFSYRVVDASGTASNTAVVRITVNSVNDAPVASDDSASVDEDSSVSINVLGNDADPDGTLPVDGVQLVAAPVNGTAVVNADGTVSYMPKANFNGVDLFSYRVVDASGTASNTAVVRVTVNSVNDAPIANDDSVTVVDDDQPKIDVLGNDSDPDGNGDIQPDSVTIITAPANGTAVWSSVDKKVVYTPNAGFSGTDAFIYSIADAAGAVSTATVTVELVPAPVVEADNVTAKVYYVSRRGMYDMTGTTTSPNSTLTLWLGNPSDGKRIGSGNADAQGNCRARFTSGIQALNGETVTVTSSAGGQATATIISL